jgi:CheY-like chemotaxis protein
MAAPLAARIDSDEPRARILVVEDNPVNLKVALGLLRNLGYPSDAATSGREAIEAARRHPYELVFMDCQMPEMDGFEAARAIRELDPSRAIRVVALTANASAADRERCLASGMDDFLSKPIDRSQLDRLLRAWLPSSRGEPAADRETPLRAR